MRAETHLPEGTAKLFLLLCFRSLFLHWYKLQQVSKKARGKLIYQARRHQGGWGGIPPNNSPRLYIEVYYTVLFNHFSVQSHSVLNLEAP